MDPRQTVRAAKALVVAGALVTVGIVGGFILASGGPGGSTATLAAKERQAVASPLSSPFTVIADQTLPAVVTIEVKRDADASGQSFRFDGPYGDFFKRMFPEMPQNPGGPNGDQSPHKGMKIPSSGSGFIIDKAGYVLTNNHVIRDASDITVILSDHRKLRAKVVGSDPGTDVAVLKVENGGDLPVVPLGDSDEIRIGDWAIAIGNALGELDGTLTVGVVSAKGRTNLAIAGGAPSYQNFIQTDASINFGNSGGPLLNIRGEAIGINTAINPSGEGIGFAIPINIARNVSKQLIASGKVTRGYLGIVPQELTPELAESWGLQGTHGVLVSSISDDTPASKAGFRVKDVITEFDGKSVDDVQKFRLLVADTPVNKKVRVRLLRQGSAQDLYVTLAERPAEERLAQATRTPGSWLGVAVEGLGGDFAKENGIREKSGVVVIDVVQGSGADDAGLQRGDIIKEVNDLPVKDTFEYNDALDKARAKNPKKPVVLLVKRGDATQFIAVDPGE
ncbi:MAG TPA: Do family serine endopeptidase [Candidatus Eisenbacteria bacterium]|nr:Do family serine endopeptidase [Candidatus Eisenbacteria bacterium]